MPSSFTTPLEIEYIGGRSWKVTREFDYLVDFNDPHSAIKVPAGFVTDFASVPEVLWDILPPTGKYGKAAVVHDYLYVMGGKIPCLLCGPEESELFSPYTKAEADQVFYDAMKVLGVGQPERWRMWRTVKAFGKGNFGKV